MEYKIKYANGWDVYSRSERNDTWDWEQSFPTLEEAARWLYVEYGYNVEILAF